MDTAAQRLHGLLMDLVRMIGTMQQAIPGDPATLSQVFALHELDSDTPLSQGELAQRLRLEKSSVSRLAAELERKGLLVRERDPANRRYYRLRLTDRGRAYHASMSAAFHAEFLRLLDGMTADEKAALDTGLTALTRAMGGQSTSGQARARHERRHRG